LGLGALLGNLSVLIAGKAPPQTPGTNPTTGQTYGQNPTLALNPSYDLAGQLQSLNPSGTDWTEKRHELEVGATTALSVIPQVAKTQGDLTVSQILTSMTNAEETIRSQRSGVASAINYAVSDAYDPIINAEEILVTKDKIAADQKALTARGLTAAQKHELQLQLTQDQLHLATLLADATQYGTNAQRVQALNGELQSGALRDGIKKGDPAALKAFQTILDEIKAAGGTVDLSPAGKAAMADYVTGMKTYVIEGGAAAVTNLIKGLFPAVPAKNTGSPGASPATGSGTNAPPPKTITPTSSSTLYTTDTGSTYYLPGFAEGGTVPGPSGEPTIAVVHGGEHITPVTSMSHSGPFAIHVHIDQGAFIDGPSVDRLTLLITQRLRLMGVG
jgi:hypothetical protein